MAKRPLNEIEPPRDRCMDGGVLATVATRERPRAKSVWGVLASGNADGVDQESAQQRFRQAANLGMPARYLTHRLAGATDPAAQPAGELQAPFNLEPPPAPEAASFASTTVA